MCKKTYSTYACGHIAQTWIETTPFLRIRTGYSPPLHPTFSIHALTNRAYLDIPPDYQYKECNSSMNRCCPIWDEANTSIFVGGLDCEDCCAVNYAAGSCCGLKKGGVMTQNYDDLDWGVRVPGEIIVGQLTRKADKKQADKRYRRKRRRLLEEDEDDYDDVQDAMPPSSVHAILALDPSDIIDPALVEPRKRANLAKRMRRELKEEKGKKRWENEPMWSDVGLEEIMAEVKWMREPCLEELATAFRSRRGWGMGLRSVNGKPTEACEDVPRRWRADLSNFSVFPPRTARLAVLQ